MRFRISYRTSLILVLLTVCLLSAAKSEDGAVDPTLVRAKEIVGQKRPDVYEHYQRLTEEFTKNLTLWEDQVAFNRWEGSIESPLFVAAWEKEWNEHPESRVAFVLYIRDAFKRDKHLRSIEALSSTITDDEKLFYSYLRACLFSQVFILAAVKHNSRHSDEYHCFA